MSLKLYSFFLSSASWRVRTVLNLKNLKYEYIPINLFEGEHKTEDFQKINPHMTVPTFLDGEKRLTESVAIIEYLEELYPDPAVLPSDPFQKAKVRAFSQIINSSMQPSQIVSTLQRLENQYNVNQIEWVMPFLDKGYQALETLLKEEGNNGKFCFGDKITLADVYLYPQVLGNVHRFNYDISRFENISRITENLKEVEAFVKAQPQNQPDFP